MINPAFSNIGANMNAMTAMNSIHWGNISRSIKRFPKTPTLKYSTISTRARDGRVVKKKLNALTKKLPHNMAFLFQFFPCGRLQ
jgi:hypothetical protein